MPLQFFKILSSNLDFVRTHCIDRNNLFQFACRKWYLFINGHRYYGKITRIHIRLIK